MKKSLLFFTMLFLSITSNAYIEVQNADGVTIYYNYINDGKELEVISINSNCYRGSVNIPEEVTFMNRTRNVTSIGECTFANCGSLTSVTIPNCLTSIGRAAFYDCSGLTSITIPNSVTNIGEYAFSGCSNLKTITIPDGVTSIGESAFADCVSLTSVILPNSITAIEKSTFAYCCSLLSVTIPEGVTEIGESAFSQCRSMTSVSFPSSVKSVGRWAFNYVGLTAVHITDIAAWCEIDFVGYWYWSNPLYYAHHLYMNGTEVKDLIIPDGVETIGNFAFGGCTDFSSVTIPNSVTSIGPNSFEGCDIPIVVSLIENPFEISSETFTQNTFKNATLYVPEGTIEKYKATSGWKEFVFISDAKRYKLTYFVDNDIYKSYEIEEGSTINAEVEPIKEGYTFSGWSDIPEIMPAHDVTVTGSFNINTYTLTYMIDDEEYKSYKVEYGASITPEPQPEGEYATFEWVGVPETMPAHDVIVTAIYTIIPKEKCAKPIISYANGKLSFTSDTEGVQFVSDITDTDIKRNYDSDVFLTATYNISVYAKKEGYKDSDVANATLSWIDVEPWAEGTKEVEDNVAQVKAMPVLVQRNDNTLSISGTNTGNSIRVYDIDGRLISSSAVSESGITRINIPNSSKILIVEINGKCIKIY